MDGLRNDDARKAANLDDLENKRAAATDTAAGEDDGVETIARIPVSRGVVVNERQEPLPASQVTSTTTAASSTPPTPPTGVSLAESQTAASSPVARDRDVERGTGQAASRPGSAEPEEISAAAQATDPLFPQTDLQQFRGRWDQVQASFVDDPRRAVQEADNLVASMVKQIAEQFAEKRGKLESQWSRGDDATTEELRQSLRQYRAFFDRLLSM